MLTVIQIIHIVICIVFVFIVMIQGSKSEGLSGLFGGGSGTLLGTGASGFMVKLTTVVGIVFLLSSIVLTIVQSQKPATVMEKSLMKEKSTPAETVPAPPEE